MPVVYGDTSESLGIRIKDAMEDKFGLKGWFDLDDLKTIDQESINAGIRSTCCLLVLLTDETILVRLYDFNSLLSNVCLW